MNNNRTSYKLISGETIEIIKNSGYTIGLKTLKFDDTDYCKAIKYPANQQVDVKLTGKYDTNFLITEQDTVSAVFACPDPKKCATLNFASAKHPGGGFQTGANAQEESLCRSSTLYASIGGNEADEMYQYNNTIASRTFYSDYMLYSPSVIFFRTFTGSLVQDFIEVSVITAPAVNCRIASTRANDAKIRKIMRERIRKIFDIAIQNGKAYLILGAWGCGVFGNKPENVAKDFASVLLEEKYRSAFETIEFAVLAGKHSETLAAFKHEFTCAVSPQCKAGLLI